MDAPSTVTSHDLAAAASLDDFQRLVDRALAARQTERPAWTRFPTGLLDAFALCPAWTDPLLAACGLTRDPEMESDGFVTRGAPPIDDAVDQQAVYRMTEAMRATVIDAALAEPESAGLNRLVSAMVGLGNAIEKAAVATLPADVSRWAFLAARAGSIPSLVESFTTRVDAAFANRDASGLLDWIETARPIAPLVRRTLDLSFDIALQQAGRQIELLQRRAADREHLRHFLPRDEPLAAFERLMNEPNGGPNWALHFLGDGGVGKTMLVRKITADIAPETYGAAVGRIDFDYLSPDYPTLAPGLLLWAFAQELRPSAGGGDASGFELGDRILRDLHQRLRADRGKRAVEADARATDDPDFRRALQGYIEAFQSIARSKKSILLIVDTCEELARTDDSGRVPPDVEETFRILRALRDGPQTLDDPAAPPSASAGVPELRVLFAGRRPLANVDPLPARPYLSVCRILGFTDSEARAFLTEVLPVRPDLIPAVLERSRWNAADTTAVPRFNPYELRLFGDWARQDDAPTADQIRAASSASYVELRILRRLRSESLERLLPIVTLLGTFDQDLLRALAPPEMDDGEFERVWNQLRVQEWIVQRYGTSGDSGEATRRMLEIEPGVRARMTEYFRGRGSILEDARRRIAAFLEPRTRDGDLSLLDASTFDAAVRALDPEPARASAWWAAVEARLPRERNWSQIHDLTSALLAGAAARPSAHLHAAIQATHAAALLHTGGSRRDIENAWNAVAAAPDADPTLRLRARPLEWDGTTPPTLTPQTTASILAAIEAANGNAGYDAAVRLAESLDSDLKSYAAMLAARRSPDAEAARRWWDVALETAANLPTPERTPAFLDWIPPDDLAARVRREWIEAAYPRWLSPAETIARAVRDMTSTNTREGAHLLAAILRVRLADAVIPEAELPSNPEPSSPLFPVFHAARAALGRLDAAEEGLRVVARSPESFDLETVRAAERALLRISVGTHLRDEHGLGTDGRTVADEPIAWLVDGLCGDKTAPSFPDSEDRHALWQTRYGPAASPRGDALLAWARENLPETPPASDADYGALALFLDRCEAKRLDEAIHGGDGGSFPTVAGVVRPGEWWRAHPDQPENALRLWLRAEWLGRTDSFEKPIARDLIDRLGRRRAAEIAFDEAARASLRLPAAFLFQRALDWFGEAGDPVGVVQAGTAAVLGGDDSLAQRVADAYGQIAERLTLPPIAVLRAAAAAFFDAFAPRAWRPLLVRLRLVLGDAPDAELRGWIERNYGAVVDSASNAVALPADLSAFLGPRAERKPVAKRFDWRAVGWIASGLALLIGAFSVGLPLIAVARTTSVESTDTYNLLGAILIVTNALVYVARSRRMPRWLRVTLWVLLTVAVPIEIAVSGSLLLVGGNDAKPAALMFGLALLPLPIAFFDWFHFVRSRWTAAQRMRLRFSWQDGPDNRPTATRTGPVRVALERVAAGGDPVPLSESLTSIHPGLPYAELALPPESRPVWDRLRRRLRDRTMPIEIAPDDGLHGPCWEAAVVLALGDGAINAPGDLPFRFRRRVASGRALRATSPDFRVEFGVMSWTGGALEGPVVAEAWGRNRGSGRNERFTTEARAGARSLEDLQPNATVHALHLVGTAEEGLGGLRLRMASPIPVGTAMTKVKIDASPMEDRFVRADEIARVFPDVAICIVQGEARAAATAAAANDTERPASDRQNAALARAFAAQVSREGIGIVLVVPPLALDRAVGVIEVLSAHLHDAVRHARNDRIDLFPLVDAVQRRILTEASAAAWESALDVCLYQFVPETTQAGAKGEAK